MPPRKKASCLRLASAGGRSMLHRRTQDPIMVVEPAVISSLLEDLQQDFIGTSPKNINPHSDQHLGGKYTDELSTSSLSVSSDSSVGQGHSVFTKLVDANTDRCQNTKVLKAKVKNARDATLMPSNDADTNVLCSQFSNTAIMPSSFIRSSTSHSYCDTVKRKFGARGDSPMCSLSGDVFAQQSSNGVHSGRTACRDNARRHRCNSSKNTCSMQLLDSCEAQSVRFSSDQFPALADNNSCLHSPFSIGSQQSTGSQLLTSDIPQYRIPRRSRLFSRSLIGSCSDLKTGLNNRIMSPPHTKNVVLTAAALSASDDCLPGHGQIDHMVDNVKGKEAIEAENAITQPSSPVLNRAIAAFVDPVSTAGSYVEFSKCVNSADESSGLPSNLDTVDLEELDEMFVGSQITFLRRLPDDFPVNKLEKQSYNQEKSICICSEETLEILEGTVSNVCFDDMPVNYTTSSVDCELTSLPHRSMVVVSGQSSESTASYIEHIATMSTHVIKVKVHDVIVRNQWEAFWGASVERSSGTYRLRRHNQDPLIGCSSGPNTMILVNRSEVELPRQFHKKFVTRKQTDKLKKTGNGTGGHNSTDLKEIGSGTFGYCLMSSIQLPSKNGKNCKLTDVVIKVDVESVYVIWEAYIHHHIWDILENLQQEIRLSHSQHIITPIGLWLYEDAACYIMPYAELGTLLDVLRIVSLDRSYHAPQRIKQRVSGDNLDGSFCGAEFITAYFAIQMLSAVEVLHQCDLIHCDIKSNNWVLRLQPKPFSCHGAMDVMCKGLEEFQFLNHLQLCLIDFGKARFMRTSSDSLIHASYMQAVCSNESEEVNECDLSAMRNSTDRIGGNEGHGNRCVAYSYVGNCSVKGMACPAMLSDTAWNAEADYFGVLACAHQLLYGDELRTIVESCACAERRGFTLPDRKISVHVQYSDLTTAASGSVEGGVTGCVRVPKVSLKRYWNKATWSAVYIALLNPSTETNNDLFVHLKHALCDVVYGPGGGNTTDDTQDGGHVAILNVKENTLAALISSLRQA